MITLVYDASEYAEHIAALEKACFSEPWSREAVEDFLSYPYNHAIVALWNDAFAGYITYTAIAGEYQIANVAVLPEFRKNGIGNAMLCELVTRAKLEHAEVVTLEVRASNTSAISLYEKTGFTKAGIRNGFYSAPKEDAVLYNLSL